MNKRVLLTWSSSWIGKYLSEMLLSLWYEVVWISRNQTIFEEWYTHVFLDLSDAEARSNFLREEFPWLGVFSSCIFNAWVWVFWSFLDQSEEDIFQQLNVNLVSIIHMSQSLIWSLEIDGKLIFMWSRASRKFMKEWAVYQATKFWLRWFAWTLSKELSQDVFFLNPKIVETSFHDQTSLAQFSSHWMTSLEDIWCLVRNILSWNEERFEIDV